MQAGPIHCSSHKHRPQPGQGASAGRTAHAVGPVYQLGLLPYMVCSRPVGKGQSPVPLSCCAAPAWPHHLTQRVKLRQRPTPEDNTAATATTVHKQALSWALQQLQRAAITQRCRRAGPRAEEAPQKGSAPRQRARHHQLVHSSKCCRRRPPRAPAAAACLLGTAG